MNINKNLKNIILAGSLALAGCKDFSYDYVETFDLKVEEDSVKVTVRIDEGENYEYSSNILSVKKPNNKIIEYGYHYYKSYSNDGTQYQSPRLLDFIEVTENGESKQYGYNHRTPFGLMNEFRSNFNRYMDEIEPKISIFKKFQDSVQAKEILE